MNLFSDISNIYQNVQVLILGSYLPKNIEILESIKKYLIEKGFSKTYLGKDLINNTGDSKNLEEVYKSIKKAMFDVNFNIFIFFNNPESSYSKENESTIIELTSLVESVEYSEKVNETLAFLPRNYDSSMLEGFIMNKRINTFEYENFQQIYQKSYIFIKQNL